MTHVPCLGEIQLPKRTKDNPTKSYTVENVYTMEQFYGTVPKHGPWPTLDLSRLVPSMIIMELPWYKDVLAFYLSHVNEPREMCG